MVYRGKTNKSYQQNEGDFFFAPPEEYMKGMQLLFPPAAAGSQSPVHRLDTVRLQQLIRS